MPLGARIHATAIVEPGAELAADVEIGPHCLVGAGVRIGAGTRLLGHVVISGRSTIGSFSSLRLVVQASPFLPLMFIASEPHTPSRHERRSDSVSSTSALMRCSASSSILSVSFSSTVRSCMYGFLSLSGS